MKSNVLFPGLARTIVRFCNPVAKGETVAFFKKTLEYLVNLNNKIITKLQNHPARNMCRYLQFFYFPHQPTDIIRTNLILTIDISTQSTWHRSVLFLALELILRE